IDHVEPGFWTNERVAPEVGANAGANVSHEMVGADVRRTPSEKAAVQSTCIEARVLAPDARHEFGRNVFRKPWGPDCVEGVKYRAKGLESAIQVLAGSPRHFAFHPQA